MKKFAFTLFTAMIIIMTSCKKEEVNPSNPDLKDPLVVCKMCEGGWDLTDSIP